MEYTGGTLSWGRGQTRGKKGRLAQGKVCRRYLEGMKRWRGMICKTVCALAWIIFSGAQAVEEEPVAAVQALLRQERLYLGPVNGVLDGPTAAGVRRYQILHGLRASGLLDDETLRVMLSPPAPSLGLAESDQRLLRELAQTPIPDPVAEHRQPIPPAEPPAVVAPGKPQATPQESKRKRAKPARHRHTSAGPLSD